MLYPYLKPKNLWNVYTGTYTYLIDIYTHANIVAFWRFTHNGVIYLEMFLPYAQTYTHIIYTKQNRCIYVTRSNFAHMKNYQWCVFNILTIRKSYTYRITKNIKSIRNKKLNTSYAPIHCNLYIYQHDSIILI